MDYLEFIGRNEALFGDDIVNCSNLVQEIVTKLLIVEVSNSK
jgi:hypothetical protein